MGLFHFIKNAGEQFSDFITGDGRDEDAIRNRIEQLGLKIESLNVDVHGDKAVLTGVAASRDVFEKAILAAGNIKGIAEVESKMTVAEQKPAQPAKQQPANTQEKPQVQAQQTSPAATAPQSAATATPSAQANQSAAPAAQAEPEPVFYVVKSGDTLSKIAKKFYGNANAYNKIFEANRPMLKSPDAIYPDQTLRIPDAENKQSVAA